MGVVRSVVAAAVAAAMAWPSCAMAEDYPTRLVRIVVPQAAGGATDTFARTIGQKLSERWKQPVVIENRAGAAGVVGTDSVAKAPADGYTLLVTYEGSQAINPSLYENLPFDTRQGFYGDRHHRNDAVSLDCRSEGAGQDVAGVSSRWRAPIPTS